MKEHPILFSTEMIRAILDGRKNQTRRVIMPQPISVLHEDEGGHFEYKGIQVDFETDLIPYCPYGKVGDTLWVRERLSLWPGTVAIYEADGEQMPSPMDQEQQNWLNDYKRATVPSIHMPRWAARIFLEITNIRVERVQDIIHKDMRAEGIDGIWCGPGLQDYSYEKPFMDLWDSINAKRYETIHHTDGTTERRLLNYSWDKNPHVWVIEFKVNSPRRAE